ncbi:hypothetical protein [Streptomyces mutabilis]|nr:hypothetical protein [Streptomyces mutabilis]
MSEPTACPVRPTLSEYLTMARGRLGNLSPAQRRIQAAVAARDTLRHNLALGLMHMSQDELVMALMEMRGALALLLSVTIPAAVPPSGELDDEDLVAHLFDLLSDAAPLHAEVHVRLGRALPDSLMASLLQGINGPQAHVTGDYVQAVGTCGTSTVHITTPSAAGGTR